MQEVNYANIIIVHARSNRCLPNARRKCGNYWGNVPKEKATDETSDLCEILGWHEKGEEKQENEDL
jgi:hypothetical protein